MKTSQVYTREIRDRVFSLKVKDAVQCSTRICCNTLS